MKVRPLRICRTHHAHLSYIVVETLEQKEARRRQQFDKAQQKVTKQCRQQAKAAERERYQNEENIGQYYLLNLLSL